MSTEIANREVIAPDAVFTSSGQQQETFAPLAPCPACGAETHPTMKQCYQEEHCYKCGYRPGVNQAVALDELRRQFEAFKAYQAENMPEHASLSAPDTTEIDTLKAQLADLKAQMVSGSNAQQPPASGVLNVPPFGGSQ